MIYLMVGNDEFGIEQAVTELRAQHEVSDLNFTRCLVSGETKPEEVLAKLVEATTLTIDGGSQLLWIRGLPLGGSSGGGTRQDFSRVYELLQALAETEASSQTSIIVVTALKVDSRSAIVKRLRGSCVYREFAKAPLWDQTTWINQARTAGNRVGIALSYPVAQRLVERVGDDPRLIDHAVQVLALHGGEPTTTLLEQLVPLQHGDGIAFARALLERDSATAHAELERLLLNQEPPLKLMALLLTQVRTWIKVRAATDEMPRADNATLAKRIGFEGNPNRIYYLKQEVQGISLPMLIGLLRLVLATEKILKSGSGHYYEQRALRDLVLAVGKSG